MIDRHFLPAFETEYILIDPRVSIFIRWIALSGQLTTVLIVHFALGFLLPLIPLLTIIAIGIILNLWQSWLNKNAVQLSRLSVLFVLIFDVTQLAALLYFAGGLLFFVSEIYQDFLFQRLIFYGLFYFCRSCRYAWFRILLFGVLVYMADRMRSCGGLFLK